MLLKISTKQKGSYGMKKELLVELNEQELENTEGGRYEYIPIDIPVWDGKVGSLGGGH